VSLESIRATRDAAREALKRSADPNENDRPTASRRVNTSAPPSPPISDDVTKT